MHREYKTIFSLQLLFIMLMQKHLLKICAYFLYMRKNIARYFNKWGWFFDGERKKINTAVLKALSA